MKVYVCDRVRLGYPHKGEQAVCIYINIYEWVSKGGWNGNTRFTPNVFESFIDSSSGLSTTQQVMSQVIYAVVVG